MRHETVQNRERRAAAASCSACPGWATSAAVGARVSGALTRKLFLKMCPLSGFLTGPGSLERKLAVFPRLLLHPLALTAHSVRPPRLGPSLGPDDTLGPLSSAAMAVPGSLSEGPQGEASVQGKVK